jgi:hypothetical protein
MGESDDWIEKYMCYFEVLWKQLLGVTEGFNTKQQYNQFTIQWPFRFEAEVRNAWCYGREWRSNKNIDGRKFGNHINKRHPAVFWHCCLMQTTTQHNWSDIYCVTIRCDQWTIFFCRKWPQPTFLLPFHVYKTWWWPFWAETCSVLVTTYC